MMRIRSRRVVLPDGVRPATIVIEGGQITTILGIDDEAPASPSIDVGDLVVMPGLVDTHVHVNEPGRTEWEGFETATRAAAAGGVTTLIDMPLNSVPATTSARALEQKKDAARGKCSVDVGFWGGVVPGNGHDLEALAAAGALGFKCFLSPSGVEEFTHVGEADLRLAMPVLARLGLPLLVHAELPDLLRQPQDGADPRAYTTWLETRPPAAELAAIDLLIRLAREYSVHVHIVHLATAAAVPGIRAAKAEGVRLTVETCPHYLALCEDDIAPGATAFKCAPPIRDRANQEGLWRALIDGTIDLVATDHSPAPAGLKHIDDGDFLAAWGGIASLQVSLPVTWTAASRRGIGLERLAAWMSAAPADLAGLSQRKGRLAPGLDADLFVFDPDVEWSIDAATLYHRHRVSPYAGMRVRGRVMKTMLRGEWIYDGRSVAPHPSGRLVC